MDNDGNDLLENEESEADGGTSAAERVLSVLLMFLQDESSDLRSVVAEGMAKVLITGRVVSANVLSRLIILWYNPISEDDAQLRHCLGSFLPAFAFRSRKNQEVVEQAFLPTIRTIVHAPSTSPLSHIIVSNVVDLFVQLCDMKNMVSYTGSNNNTQAEAVINSTRLDAYEHFVHDSIAMKICNEILTNTSDVSYVKLLTRALTQLTICPRNITGVRDLIELSSQIMDVLHDNRPAKKLVEKFQMRLQGVSLIETTQGCSTVASESTLNPGTAKEIQGDEVTSSEANNGETISDQATHDQAISDNDNTNSNTEHGSGANDIVDEEIFSQGKNLKSELIPTSVLKNPLTLSSRRESRHSRNVSFRSPPPKMQRLSTSSVDFKIN